MENSLLDSSKKLIDNIENLDDLVDGYFAPIKDYTDTAKDIFSPIKAIHSLYTFNKKRKFKNFLKTYAESFSSNNLNSFENTEKLKNYLKVERNFNFLSDTIENAINAKSIYGSMILGYYAGQILAGSERIRFKELIIIEGLKELNDIEISCFFRIYSVANLAKPVHIGNLNEIKLMHYFASLTVEKMIQLRMLEKDAGIYLYNDDEEENENTASFISTDIAEDIFFLIKDTPIYNELMNYAF